MQERSAQEKQDDADRHTICLGGFAMFLFLIAVFRVLGLLLGDAG